LQSTSKPEARPLDTYPFAVQLNEDGTVVVGSSDTQAFIEVIEELKRQGVEVEFEGVLYGLPWCG